LEYEDLSSLSVSMRVAPRDADGKTKAMTSSQRGNHFLSFLPNFASFSSQLNLQTSSDLSPNGKYTCVHYKDSVGLPAMISPLFRGNPGDKNPFPGKIL
jgi:hypothetical protein